MFRPIRHECADGFHFSIFNHLFCQYYRHKMHVGLLAMLQAAACRLTCVIGLCNMLYFSHIL